MGLREEIRDRLIGNYANTTKLLKTRDVSEKLAIGFVEWFSDNYLKYHDHGMHYTTKELLEIYKKTL